MTSAVYFGSARQTHLDGKETLPAKLDLILDQLHLRERVKDEMVALKMHVGTNLSYSTIHPVFVRKVVQAIKEGGGKPFIVDVDRNIHEAEQRGYNSETLGCPVYPIAGPSDKYFYVHEHPFKNMTEWKVGGLIEDATFLVNFSHVKGHPSCSFGAAFKNIALGCMVWETRSAMHDTGHFDRYWFPEKCPDAAARQRIAEACPFKAIEEDRDAPGEMHLHLEQCNQCGRCLKVAPPGSLKLDPVNFLAFQEACAISTSITLSTFTSDKSTHIALATHMTPVCDCFGFTSMQVLPDAGIFGSDDIVALDSAILDVTGKSHLIEENLPTSMEVHTREGHPFAWLHGPLKDPYQVTLYGERLGLGSRDYKLVDLQPVEFDSLAGFGYIPAK